jgi:hypothetical protein
LESIQYQVNIKHSMVRGKGNSYFVQWVSEVEENFTSSSKVKDFMEKKEFSFKFRSEKYLKSSASNAQVFTFRCCQCDMLGKLTIQGRHLTFETTGEAHSCDIAEEDSEDESEIKEQRGCTRRQKAWVVELYCQNFKTPGQILNRMRILQFADHSLPDIPSFQKLRSLLPRIQRENVPHVDISLLGFQSFADTHKETDNPDVMFVPGYEEDTEGTVAKFRLCLSTKRLLTNFVPNTATVMYADDTQDVIWCGFTVIILGFTDADRVFHIVIVALCSHKTAADYHYVYSIYKKYNPNHVIHYSLSDGATQIFNGFMNAYGDQTVVPKRLMCWMHIYIKNFLPVKKSIGIADVKDDESACQRRKHIRHFLDLETKCLHQASSVEMFNHVVNLWEQKYVMDMDSEGQTKISQVILVLCLANLYCIPRIMYCISLICTVFRGLCTVFR